MPLVFFGGKGYPRDTPAREPRPVAGFLLRRATDVRIGGMAEDTPQPTGPDPAKKAFFAKHFPWLEGDKPTGRDAFCSFCRESCKDVGPLVEGPDGVFICRDCVRLCDRIFDHEEQRRAGRGNGSSASA